MHSSLRSAHRAAAFTLLEIMLVVAIIMLLLGSGAYYLRGQLELGRITKARGDVVAYNTALKTYTALSGTYPTTAQGLAALVTKPTTSPVPPRWQPTMETLVKDPWNNDYVYVLPGKKNPKGFDLFSKGPDGVEGTEDDIGNWEPPAEKP